jgi:hypothetical protein
MPHEVYVTYKEACDFITASPLVVIDSRQCTVTFKEKTIIEFTYKDEDLVFTIGFCKAKNVNIPIKDNKLLFYDEKENCTEVELFTPTNLRGKYEQKKKKEAIEKQALLAEYKKRSRNKKLASISK